MSHSFMLRNLVAVLLLLLLRLPLMLCVVACGRDSVWPALGNQYALSLLTAVQSVSSYNV